MAEVAASGAALAGAVAAAADDTEDEGDIYTDNSPEALVRRAAWNKGLRCRRGYGPHEIPVAFVKGKVAVYVYDGEKDEELDSTLKEEGWTTFWFPASEVTDGHTEADQITAAVKANSKATKSGKKKTSKKKE